MPGSPTEPVPCKRSSSSRAARSSSRAARPSWRTSAGFHGARVVATSDVDAYDGHLRFAWRMLDADGVVTLEGIDFGELAPDGRLKRIVGFFGPLPAP